MIEKLTGEDMLLLMARLRAIEEEDVREEMNYIYGKLGLKKILKEPISKYS